MSVRLHAWRRRSSFQSHQILQQAIEPLESRRLLATITVTSTADTITPNDGAVTLREAITAINAGSTTDTDITAQNPGTFGTNDAIHFNISGTGVQTIEPSSELPTINKPMTIDGYSQSGAAAATNTAPATILIELDGENAGAADGLDITTSNVTVDGPGHQSLHEQTGIFLYTDEIKSNQVWGNYIGVSTDGQSDEGNGNFGIDESGSIGDTIGGSNAADRNVISGNDNAGIYIEPPPGGEGENTFGVVVEGNYIGTDVAPALKAASGQYATTASLSMTFHKSFSTITCTAGPIPGTASASSPATATMALISPAPLKLSPRQLHRHRRYWRKVAAERAGRRVRGQWIE